ncbi:beta-N-acetylhexosaminidase [Couchioplanes caeruleus]|uniref:beta-N-acetylhexosaminidase n=2 Tax=Couchioplanes caeruleus TaxID=56438 RepID=A0A1K0FHH5_9ACTN|nr:beta-N-acetylhexosaminidase [Couchioplanes caeruleus]OJF12295.1 beta-N-acetylhexosaminidase [Couchioplanes caeruleus subsp. caeruleus]ROP31463.1 hexosaminidase [Couchioplanes caeruleus]
MAKPALIRLLAVAVLGLPAVVAPAPASAGTPPDTPALTSVIPAPAEVTPASGTSFRLGPRTVIRTQPGSRAARAVGERLAEDLRPATGYPLPVVSTVRRGTPSISLMLGTGLGAEGYRLTVGASAITIQAEQPAGLFAGTRTLLQLLPAQIDSPTPVRRSWAVAGGRIVDHPRFAYRGAMLDLARHFHTPDEVKSYVDEISRFKVNHLHLHLSDDQGWRIQIESWPRLTTVSGGPGTGVDGAGPGYLTRAQYTDLVAYAAARFVTIVPEIDMPGHVNAAQVAYPELACDGVAPPPRTDTAVGYSSLCIGSETTYRFVDDVLRELAAMTPGPYLHIGGDEAHATPEADYLSFMARVLPLVARHGKTASGWNEIAKSPASATAIAQYWDTASANPTVAAAVARGTKVVMSPADRAYLDMKYDRHTPLGLSWAGYIEVRTAYDWDPATRVTGIGEPAILGVEAPLWSETLRTLDDIEFMAFPRLPAIAELGWSPPATHDWNSFATRLGAYGPRWELRDVNFYPSPQIVWG